MFREMKVSVVFQYFLQLLNPNKKRCEMKSIIRKSVFWLSLLIAAFQLSAQTPTTSLQYPVRQDPNRSNVSGFTYLEDTALDWNLCHHKDVNNQCVGGYGNWYSCGDVFHPGWDMNYPNEVSEAVYPIADGVVHRTRLRTTTGSATQWNEIIIKHDVGGQFFYSAYGHMARRGKRSLGPFTS